MSLTAALNTANTSLRTLQTQIRVTSANIANANQENYSRKIVGLTTPALDNNLPGAPIVGSVTRVTATYLQNDLNNSISDTAAYDLLKKYSVNIANFVDANSSKPDLSNLYSKFEQAWKDFEVSPEDPVLQSTVIQSGDTLATKIRNLNAETLNFDQQVISDISIDINTLNGKLSTIANLNQQIVTFASTNQPIGDLEDQRDAALRDVAELVKIRTVPASNGQIYVYTAAGTQLVGQGVANQFAYSSASSAPYNTIQVTSNGVASGSNLASQFTGGRIGSALRYRDGSLLTSSNSNDGAITKYQNQLDVLADNLIKVVNGAYNTAATSTPAPTPAELASNFFQHPTPTSPQTVSSVIAVDSTLLAGTASVKRLSAATVQQALATDVETIRNAAVTTSTVTFNAATDQVTYGAAHGLSTGQTVRFSYTTGGSAPTDNSGNSMEYTEYYAIVVNATTIQLATTAANAAAGTAVNIATAGANVVTPPQALGQSGLSLTTVAPAAVAGGFLSYNARAASDNSDYLKTSEVTKNALDQRVRNIVQVDMDQEVADLQILQNAYAANARVMTAVTEMFNSLMQIGG